jgi:hypothetical protein
VNKNSNTSIEALTNSNSSFNSNTSPSPSESISGEWQVKTFEQDMSGKRTNWFFRMRLTENNNVLSGRIIGEHSSCSLTGTKRPNTSFEITFHPHSCRFFIRGSDGEPFYWENKTCILKGIVSGENIVGSYTTEETAEIPTRFEAKRVR